MQKFFVAVLIALFAVSCSGSRGCGCPTWGSAPSDNQKVDEMVMTPAGANEFVWN